jgi:aldehyde dehydrogenase (NAD+)
LIGAIAAGNCAVLKPSELIPNCAEFFAKYVPMYLDPECFVVVNGAVETTKSLLEQKWDKIFFTGSTRVGKIVMKAAAEHLTSVSLELGGKSPTIVDPSVSDLTLAANRVVWGKFINAGQTCIAPDYVLCHSKVGLCADRDT